jgi:predicted DNA-binding transcriptional regulator AlpA
MNQSLFALNSSTQFSVPKTSITPADEVKGPGPTLVTVRQLVALYGISMESVYTFIKTDTTFPYRNVGLKKKYMVDVAAFERWMVERTDRERCKVLHIPTAFDLLRRFGK